MVMDVRSMFIRCLPMLTFKCLDIEISINHVWINYRNLPIHFLTNHISFLSRK